MAKKLGFALGAGGSRGVAHAGFLKAMEEEGIFPDYISGCSMGSVVGSCYALGMKPDEIINEFTNLKFSDIFDLSLNPLGSGALLRSKKLYKKMQTYLKDSTFNDVKTPFTCVATDLISGQTKAFSGNTKLLDAVIASSSIPGVFRAMSIDNMSLVDGGLRCRVPIEQVRDMGAEVVVAVDVLGKIRECEKKYNIFSVLFRMFDIMDADITYKRVSLLKPDLYIEPDLGDMVQYKFKGIDQAVEIGYQTGKEYAEKIKELIK